MSVRATMIIIGGRAYTSPETRKALDMAKLTKAQEKRKREMEAELNFRDGYPTGVAKPSIHIQAHVDLDDHVAIKLNEIAQIRGISVERLVNAKMQAMCNQYDRGKILRLVDKMPYGQYQGMLMEEVIRVDPRYCNYLATNSDTFVLDEEATELLKELS